MPPTDRPTARTKTTFVLEVPTTKTASNSLSSWRRPTTKTA